MDFTDLLLEYDNISFPLHMTEEEEDKERIKQKKLWNDLLNALKYPPYVCGCYYETNDFKDHISHCIKCENLKITTEDVFSLMEEHELLEYIRVKGVTCKYCLKTFNDKRSGGRISLHQHQRRGKPFSCVNKALNELVDKLDMDEKISLLHKLRNK